MQRYRRTVGTRKGRILYAVRRTRLLFPAFCGLSALLLSGGSFSVGAAVLVVVGIAYGLAGFRPEAREQELLEEREDRRALRFLEWEESALRSRAMKEEQAEEEEDRVAWSAMRYPDAVSGSTATAGLSEE